MPLKASIGLHAACRPSTPSCTSAQMAASVTTPTGWPQLAERYGRADDRQCKRSMPYDTQSMRGDGSAIKIATVSSGRRREGADLRNGHVIRVTSIQAAVYGYTHRAQGPLPRYAMIVCTSIASWLAITCVRRVTSFCACLLTLTVRMAAQ